MTERLVSQHNEGVTELKRLSCNTGTWLQAAIDARRTVRPSGRRKGLSAVLATSPPMATPKLLGAALVVILLYLSSCAAPSSDRYLKHYQEAIILHDGTGRKFVATHLNGDTWTLLQ